MGRGGAGSEEHDEEEWNEVGRLLPGLHYFDCRIWQ